MKIIKQWRIITLIVLTATVLIACGPPSGVRDSAPVEDVPALAVESLTVTRGLLFREIQASGTVSGSTEAYVVSETQGIIEAVTFELGDRVEPGQILLRVDDTLAKLNMEQARQQYETAQIEFTGVEQLFNSGNASKTQLTRARSAASSARAAMERAVKSYNDTAIKAPIGGFIAQREGPAALGNFLTPGLQLARIVDLSSLKVEVAIGEGQIGLVQTGAPADVVIPAAVDPKTFSARVKAVAAGSDPLTGSFKVVVSWNNPFPERIKSGMSARVSIGTGQQEPVILVPTAAIADSGGEAIVFTVVQGQAVEKRIQIGRTLGNNTEVLEGLQENEEIIITALSALKQGTAVKSARIGNTGDWE